MAQKFEVVVTRRQDIGKGASRRLRRKANQIPAIIYGGHEAPQTVCLEHISFAESLRNEAMYTSILNLNIEGAKQQAVLKAIQRHPYKPKILHVDFLRVSPTDVITMRIPLHFLNEDSAPGLKAGGIISHIMTDVEIRCMAKDLPEFIAVDVGNLELEDVVHLSDLKLPKDVHLLHPADEDHDQPVVSIHIPRAVVEEEEGAPVAPSAVPTVGETEAPEGEGSE